MLTASSGRRGCVLMTAVVALAVSAGACRGGKKPCAVMVECVARCQKPATIPGPDNSKCVEACGNGVDDSVLFEYIELTMCEMEACRELVDAEKKATNFEANIEEMDRVGFSEQVRRRRQALRDCARKHCREERRRCGNPAEIPSK